MTGKTSIQWTHQPGYEGGVWNPSVGCTRVSAGCDNCYAFALHDKRHVSNADAVREFLSLVKDDATFQLPLPPRKSNSTVELTAWARAQNALGHGPALPWPSQYDLPFSRVQLLPDRLDAPLRKRKPTCYFVDSMADLFHEDVPDEFLNRVFSTMYVADRHRFLILTKRPERMREYLSRFKPSPSWDGYVTRDGDPSNAVGRSGNVFAADHWPLPNVWLGVSVEDQAAADARIPHLLATPAAVRFLSCEPLIGPVGLSLWMPPRLDVTINDHTKTNVLRYDPGLDWVIIGGESGPRARPMDLAWARSLRDQCRAAGVAVFVKQLGARPTYTTPCLLSEPCHQVEPCEHMRHLLGLRDSHGGRPDEWPEDLRVREFPQ